MGDNAAALLGTRKNTRAILHPALWKNSSSVASFNCKPFVPTTLVRHSLTIAARTHSAPVGGRTCFVLCSSSSCPALLCSASAHRIPTLSIPSHNIERLAVPIRFVLIVLIVLIAIWSSSVPCVNLDPSQFLTPLPPQQTFCLSVSVIHQRTMPSANSVPTTESGDRHTDDHHKGQSVAAPQIDMAPAAGAGPARASRKRKAPPDSVPSSAAAPYTDETSSSSRRGSQPATRIQRTQQPELMHLQPIPPDAAAPGRGPGSPSSSGGRLGPLSPRLVIDVEPAGGIDRYVCASPVPGETIRRHFVGLGPAITSGTREARMNAWGWPLRTRMANLQSDR